MIGDLLRRVFFSGVCLCVASHLPPSASNKASSQERLPRLGLNTLSQQRRTVRAPATAMLVGSHVAKQQQQQQQQHQQQPASGSCHQWRSVNDSTYSSGNFNAASANQFGYPQHQPQHHPHQQQHGWRADPTHFTSGFGPTPATFAHDSAQLHRSFSNVTDESKLSGSHAPARLANDRAPARTAMDVSCRYDAQRTRSVVVREKRVVVWSTRKMSVESCLSWN